MKSIQFSRSMKKSKASLLKIVLATFLLLGTMFAQAQVDKEFWFAAPYATKDHGPGWPLNNMYIPGGQPVSITIASFDLPVTVTIDIPLQTAAGNFTPFTYYLAANDIRKIDMTPYMNMFIPDVNNNDAPQPRGIHITATNIITAYYEIEAVLNPDIFSMKGSNSLGTNFYLPIQNKWDNDPRHESTNPDVSVLDIPDEARSYGFIVATEDNTVVTITPTALLENGHVAGVPYSKTLNRGEIYYIQAEGSLASQHIGGTHITSTKPIAVTIGDDSMYDQDFDACGQAENWRFEDYNGDQLIPVDLLGYEYIVMKGKVGFTSTGYVPGSPADPCETTVNLHEHVFITAVTDNTPIYINGSSTPITTLNAGKQFAYDLTLSSNSLYALITTDPDKKIYVYHLGGYIREMAGAIIPPISACTGSYQIGFGRNNGTHADEFFSMNLLVRTGGQGGFVVKTNNVVNTAATNKILLQTFTSVPGTDWMVATVEFTVAELGIGQHLISNDLQPFHVGVTGSTAHDWDGTEPNQDYRLMGANYGYFSSYEVLKQDAWIVNAKTNDRQDACFPEGTTVFLQATGGYAYQWSGEYNSGTHNNKVWTPIETSKHPSFYMNNTTVYNPFLDPSIPIGEYRYKVDISADGDCGNDTTIYLYVCILKDVPPNDVTDTVCETVPGTKMSEGYDLYELEDTIIGRDGYKVGNYIEGWYKLLPAQTVDISSLGTWTSHNGSTFSATGSNQIYEPTPGNNVRRFTMITNNNPTGVFTSSIISPTDFIDPALNPVVTLDVYQDYNEPNEGSNPVLTVTALLRSTSTGQTYTATATIQKPQFANQAYKNFWQTLSFNFAGAPAGTYDQIQFSTNSNITWKGVSMYIDNLKSGTKVLDNFDDITLATWAASTGTMGAVQVLAASNQLETNLLSVSSIANNTGYIEMALDPTEYINLSAGTVFTLDAASRFPLSASYNWVDIGIIMALVDGNGVEYKVGPRVITKPASSTGEVRDSWHSFIFDFTGYPSVPIHAVRLYNTGGVNNGDTYSYYFKNFTWNAASYFAKVDPNPITVYDGDTLYAHVINDAKPTWDSIYAKAVISVLPSGRAVHNITTAPFCATNGNLLEGVDLDKYKYAVGGALVAEKRWFLDANLTLPVDNAGTPINEEHDVDVPAPQYTYYAEVHDECLLNNKLLVGSVTIPVIAKPILEPVEITVCGDLTINASGTRANVNLFEYEDNIIVSSGAWNVEWYRDTALKVPISGTQIYSVEVGDGDKFYAKVYSSLADCYDTTSLTVNVQKVTPIVFEDKKFCFDAPVYSPLYATPDGGTFSGTGVSGFTFSPAIAGPGIHYIKYATGGLCSITDSAAFEVFPAITGNITANPANPVDWNTSTDITVNVIAGTYTYLWSNGATTKTFNTGALTQNKDYTVTVTNTVTSCTAVFSYSVVVEGAPPTVTLNFSQNPVCEGDSVTITAIATGYPPFTYTWTHDLPVGSYRMVNPYTIRAKAVQTSNISVLLTDARPQDITASGILTVYDAPVTGIPQDQYIVCQNELLGIPGNPSGGTEPYTHVWQPTTIISSGASTSAITINTTDNVGGPYNIQYTVTDAHGCKATEPVLVTINPLPVINPIQSPGSVCALEFIQFNTTFGAGGWSANGTDTWTSVPANMVNYLSATDIPNPIFTAPQIYGFVTFTYTYTNEYGCSASQNVSLEVLAKPVVTLNPISDICVRSEVYLLEANSTLGKAPYTYTWSSNTLNAATNTSNTAMIDVSIPKSESVSVSVVDVNGCSSTVATDNIDVYPNPVAQIYGADEICLNSDLELTSVIESGVTYSWTGTGVGYLSSTSGSPVTFNSDNDAVYNLRLTASHIINGSLTCSSFDDHQITVLPLPEVSLGPDWELCIGNYDTLMPTDLSGVALKLSDYTSIAWALDDERLSSTDNLNPIFSQPDGNSYRLALTVTDLNNCSNTDTLQINPLQLPIANAGIDKNDAAPGIEYSLDGSATSGTPGYTYVWSPVGVLTSSNTLEDPSYIITATTEFLLTVTDSKGCKDQDRVIVMVCGSIPTVTPEQDEVCEGNDLILQGVPSGGSCGVTPIYRWYDGATLLVESSVSDSLIISNPVDGHVYTFEYISGSYAPVREDITINVTPNPDIEILPSNYRTVCLNDIETITANVTSTTQNPVYTWTEVGSSLKIVGDTYSFRNSTSTGVFAVGFHVQDGLCYNDDTVRFEVVPLPSVVIEDDTACVNKDLLILSVASGGTSVNGTYNYTWEDVDNSGYLTATNSSTASFRGDMFGRYTVSVVASDDNNCKGSDFGYIFLNPEPVNYLEPQYSICSGDSLILDFNPNNDPLYDATITITGGTGQSYIVNSTNQYKQIFYAVNNGTYTITYEISDSKGCPFNGQTTITINPSVDIAPIEDFDMCILTDTLLTADIGVVDPALVSFLWTGSSINPKNEQTATFTASTVGESIITVHAQRGSCYDDEQFTITVNPNPDVAIIRTDSDPIIVGGSYDLKGIILNPTTEPYKWEWQPSAAISTSNNTESITTIPLVLQTLEYVYTVTLTDANGCSAESSFSIELLKKPTIKVGWPTNGDLVSLTDQVDLTVVDVDFINFPSICEGDKVQLLPYLEGASAPYYNNYEWSRKDASGNWVLLPQPEVNQMNPFVTPPVGKNDYRIVASNDYGSSVTGYISVIVNPNPNASITVIGDPDKYYTLKEYQLQGNDGISIETESVWTASVQSTLTDINGNTAVFTGVNPNTTYSVSYEAIAKYGTLSCRDKATIVFSFTPIPPINAPDACQGDTTIISLPSGNIASWIINGGKAITSPYNVNSVTVVWTTPGTHKITAFNSDYTVFADVKVTEKATITIYGPQHVCEYEKAEYKAETNADIISWEIYTNELTNTERIVTVPDLTDKSVNVSWLEAGYDSVTAYAYNFGCNDSATIPVTIHKNPTPSFTYTPKTNQLNSGDEVTFINTSVYDEANQIYVGETNVAYYWDYVGDGVYSENVFEDKYTYDEAGLYEVQLMAIDTIWGCKSVYSDTVRIYVNDSCFMTFPNAITPQLGSNNEFYPVLEEGVLERGYELRIYNRWGTLLWSSTDKHATWNGVYKSEIVKQDVYVYHCKATCEMKDENGDNVILNIKGDITVIK